MHSVASPVWQAQTELSRGDILRFPVADTIGRPADWPGRRWQRKKNKNYQNDFFLRRTRVQWAGRCVFDSLKICDRLGPPRRRCLCLSPPAEVSAFAKTHVEN